MTEPATRPDAVSGLRRSRRRIELYTLSSLDILIVSFALLLLLQVWARSPSWGIHEGAATLGTVLLAAACIAVIHRPRGGGRPGRFWWVSVGVLTAGTTAVVILRRSAEELYTNGAGEYFMAFVPLLIAFTAVSLYVGWRRLVPVALVAAVATTGLFAIVGLDGVGLGVLAGYGFLAGCLGIATGAFTFWMLDVIRQLDDARATAGRLAVAEERLRFSRDLHDVYGRTLSAIAMKSELAAELAARGDDRAVPQMRSVRELAQESLAEVRGLVAGYREASLETEVAGASAMLRSARARFEVRGLDEACGALSPAAQTVLAWVVREAVTNVIRHSHARVVSLVANLEGERVVMTIANDGVEFDASGATSSGHGLRGLAERVGAVGGSVETDQHGDRFTLTVVLPAGAPNGR